jgi:acyl-CoA synthetase (AMP-forming)/AMP-acid ligase II
VTPSLSGCLDEQHGAKDLVKSGGEWISSQEIERHALSHPAVAMAAVIGVPHQKWGERPRLIIQRSAGTNVTADDIRTHLDLAHRTTQR